MKLYTGEILFQTLDEEILLCLIDKFCGRYPILIGCMRKLKKKI